MTLSQLEFRIKSLEKKLAELTEKQTSSGESDANAWIDQIHGTFQNNAMYQQAAKVGRKWRKSPNRVAKSRSRKTARK